MPYWLDVLLVVPIAGFCTGALAFVALVMPAIMTRVFRRDAEPDGDEVVLLGLRLFILTIVTVWPTLIWLWWP